MEQLEDANVVSIGSIAHISETIPVHLEPGAVPSGCDYYKVYIKQYNSILYLPSVHLHSGTVTEYTVK